MDPSKNIPEMALAEANLYISRRDVKGDILFCMLTGSQAYNLALDSSDYDWIGMYLADIDDVLSFAEPLQTVTKLPNEDKPDITIHEAKNFIKLLLEGNPFVMESLFAKDTLCYQSEDWRDFLKFRKLFLTRETVEKHLGYTCLKVVFKMIVTLKTNLLYITAAQWLPKDILRILEGKEPILYLDSEICKEEHQHLLKIKTGQISAEDFEKEARDLIDKVESMRPFGSVPTLAENNTEEIAHQWLVKTRTKYFLLRDVQ